MKFERIEIRGLLGIPQGQGFTLDNLHPAVNLIHGPNGSGKTTTIRAIQELLWPGQTCRDGKPSLSGNLVEGTARWRVEIEGARVRTTPSPPPVVQTRPPEDRHRYRLALHELLGTDDADFAQKVIRESHGGFDLPGAEAALGFSSKAKASAEKAAYDRSADLADQATRNQSLLDEQAAMLTEKETQLAESITADQQRALLQRALDYTDATAQSARLEQELAALPPQLKDLREDARRQVDLLDRQRAEAREALRKAREAKEDAKRAIEAASLPDEGVDPQILRNLRAWQRQATTCNRELESRRLQRIEAATAEEGARAQLGPAIPPDRLDALMASQIKPLGELDRQANRVRARMAHLEERDRTLRARESELSDCPDEDRLSRGIAALHEWLLTGPAGPSSSPSRTNWIALAPSLALGLLGLALAVALHPVWLLLCVLSGALLVLVFAGNKPGGSPGSGDDPAAIHRATFEATRLPPPGRWDSAGVQECLGALVGQRIRAENAKACREERRKLEAEQKQVEVERNGLDAQKRDVENQLGITLALDTEWLPSFIQTLGRWKAAREALAVLDNEIQKLDRDCRDLMDKIADGLAPFGFQRPAGPDQAGAVLDELEARQQAWSRNTEKWNDLDRRLRDEYEPAVARLEAQRAAMLTPLGLQEGMEHRIDEWLALLPEWKRVERALGEAKTARTIHAQSLGERKDLLDLDRAELENRLAVAGNRSARRDELNAAIVTIKSAVEQTRAGYALTDALAVRDGARTRLEAACDRCGQASAGAALGDWLRKTALKKNQPHVLQRAGHLLLGFTRGALQLELGDNAGTPRFMAFRHGEPPRPVDQLSSGERVQLLIAVRLAFLEQGETTPLPLLLDETLGNSDDIRAGAIIDAVKDIARSGRQVFYFTAQYDEVGKWKAHLGAEVAFREFDLATLRGLPAPGVTPLAIAPAERPEVPAPASDDYAAYGALLGVPKLDPRVENIGPIHLWHMLDDVHTLHRLLRLGITTWGPFQALAENGGAALVDPSSQTLRRARSMARAIEIAFEAWREGRGKRVDRAALEEAVKPAFLEQVAALAEEANGDAGLLLQKLTAKAVPKWGQGKTDDLRQYLVEREYLADRPPLQPEDVRGRVLAAMANDLADGRLTQPGLERVLRAVGA